MRISDWSSDVCSSDLVEVELAAIVVVDLPLGIPQQGRDIVQRRRSVASLHEGTGRRFQYSRPALFLAAESRLGFPRSEEHTSELQSLMRISYAVFCLKKKKTTTYKHSQLRNTPSNQHSKQ